MSFFNDLDRNKGKIRDKLIQYECAIIHVRGVKVWFQLLKSNMGKNEKDKFRFKV